MRLTHTTRAPAMLSLESLLCRVGFDNPGRGLSTSRENYLILIPVREGRSSMPTDWNLIRDMMAAVIDSCEQIEAAGYAEEDRDLTVDVSGHSISIQDFMVSAWTLPENLRYQIIRDRHEKGVDLAYRSRSGPHHRENGGGLLGINRRRRGEASGFESAISNQMVSRARGPSCPQGHRERPLRKLDSHRDYRPRPLVMAGLAPAIHVFCLHRQ